MKDDIYTDGLIDFSKLAARKEEKETEPLFQGTTIIAVGEGEETFEYLLLVNAVIDGRQLLAIESLSKHDEGDVYLVEAEVNEKGEFQGVHVIEDEDVYTEFQQIVINAFEQVAEAEGEPNE